MANLTDIIGKADAASSPITAIMGKLGGVLKDQDGDGDVDFQDILITLKGGKGASQSKAGGLLGAASGILGMFKK